MGEDELLESLYGHLNISNDLEMRSKVLGNMDKYRSTIRTLTAAKRLSSVSDIFKYQVDKFGNMYILYKNYGKDPADVPYVEKLHTPGTLWVRLADSPLAFPVDAVTGIANDTDGSQMERISGNVVYDVEVLPAGNKICVAYAASKESPDQIVCMAWYIDYVRALGCGLGSIVLSTSLAGGTLY